MVQEDLTLRFSGVELEKHTMDVRVLAPALLAFADVLKSAQEVVNPQASVPAIEIKATSKGSFIVELVSTSTFLDGVLDFLTSRTMEAGLNAVGLGGCVVGAVSLIKALFKNGKNPKREKDDDGSVTLTWADGTVLTIPEASISLAQNALFRKHFEAFIEPVSRDGIDTVELSGTNFNTVSVVKEEVPAFTPDKSIEELQVENVRDVLLQIVQLTLQGDYRWRFSDGGATFTAVMCDEDFKARITGRELRFAEGDQLSVTMVEKQYRKSDGSLRTDREIIKVLDHIHAPEQTVLIFDTEDTNDADTAS